VKAGNTTVQKSRQCQLVHAVDWTHAEDRPLQEYCRFIAEGWC
jgi:hypothetical protein